MKLSACGKTDRGLVRSNNEDRFFMSEREGFFMVADGMGGHAAGEVASEMAVHKVCEFIFDPQQESAACPQLAEAIQDANEAVARAAETNPAWKGMGTTLTALRLDSRCAYVAHVGDSRAYRFRKGRLERITEDHTLVEDQVRQGLMTHAEAASSELRNILTQAVGLSERLNIFLKTMGLAEKDRFLLCSDGLTDMLSEERVAALFDANEGVTGLCERLVEEACRAGGRDNISVVVIEVEGL